MIEYFDLVNNVQLIENKEMFSLYLEISTPSKDNHKLFYDWLKQQDCINVEFYEDKCIVYIPCYNKALVELRYNFERNQLLKMKEMKHNKIFMLITDGKIYNGLYNIPLRISQFDVPLQITCFYQL